jgi:hypothetical protein
MFLRLFYVVLYKLSTVAGSTNNSNNSGSWIIEEDYATTNPEVGPLL